MPQKMQDIVKRKDVMPPQEAIPGQAAEQMPAPYEVAPEAGIERPSEVMPQGPVVAEQPVPTMPVPQAAPVPAMPVKSPTLEKIEDILEEDLEQIYFQMPPQKQVEFNAVGQETAGKIEGILRGVKINVRKILELIIHWLKIIPGVNKFFLEQEAKIKTDEILKLKGEQNKNIGELKH